jgi:hypothetical protein
VVRKTLRFTGVSLEDIIRSAEARELALAKSVGEDRAAITELERQIAARQATIHTALAELQEVQGVRDRLEEAVEKETKVGLLLPADEIARLQAEGPPSKAPPIPPVALGVSLGPSKSAAPPPVPKKPAPPKAPEAPKASVATAAPSLADPADGSEPTKRQILTGEGTSVE